MRISRAKGEILSMARIPRKRARLEKALPCGPSQQVSTRKRGGITAGPSSEHFGIYPYIPFAGALVWNRVREEDSPVKVHVSFSPDWFASRMGLDLGERWHRDPSPGARASWPWRGR